MSPTRCTGSLASGQRCEHSPYDRALHLCRPPGGGRWWSKESRGEVRVKVEVLEILCCPATGQALTLHDERLQNGEVMSGDLRTVDGSRTYPIVNYVPRFVP